MQNSYLDHPAEEALERFLLHQCPETELETVETHILACDDCVSRLEALETEIAVMKTALQELERKQVAAAAARQQRSSWKTWLTVPNLSWAGAAAAALAAALVITPQLVHRPVAPAEVQLAAYRGIETASVPQGRPLHVRLDGNDLPGNEVMVQLVDDTGAELWKGSAAVAHAHAVFTAPAIAHPGAYLIRVYAAGSEHAQLLHEFSIQAK
jgi:hypothetical protein